MMDRMKAAALSLLVPALAFAQQQGAGTGETTASNSQPMTGGGGDAGGIPWLLVFLVVAALAVAIIGFRASGRRRAGPPPHAPTPRSP